MTGVTVAKSPAGFTGTEFARLKAESERLRREFLRSTLEIGYTIATFPQAKPSSIKLEESCRATARKTFTRLEQMLPVDGQADDEFAAKLNRFRDALDNAPTDAAAAPAPPANREHLHKGLRLDTLTRREIEVLKYIAQGNSTKKVAEILGITFKTAACHRYRVMDKLGIHETANLVRYAIRNGMVEA